MDHLPLDARGVVDELRSTSSSRPGGGLRGWVPSTSFDALASEAALDPVLLNDHLTWLHENCDLDQLLVAPAGSGLRAFGRRLVYRAVVSVLEPYLVRVKDCIAVTVRAIDTVARRVDEQAATQARAVAAMRSDLVDFARDVEGRLEG
jgi:hypothetical protein